MNNRNYTLIILAVAVLILILLYTGNIAL